MSRRRSKKASGTVSRTAHAGDLRDHVVEALEVLDVDAWCRRRCRRRAAPRCPGSAARGGCRGRWCARARRPAPPAAGARAARRGRAPRGLDPCSRAPAGQDLETLEQSLGLGAAVRLDEPDHHVDALALQLARGVEHGVGLAHARRRAEEDLEPAAAAARRLSVGAPDAAPGARRGRGASRSRRSSAAILAAGVAGARRARGSAAAR